MKPHHQTRQSAEFYTEREELPQNVETTGSIINQYIEMNKQRGLTQHVGNRSVLEEEMTENNDKNYIPTTS